jgi:hypothetical protein
VVAGCRMAQPSSTEEVNIRTAYHDLPDPEPGFTPDAQIEIMSVALRHYHDQSQVRVERFTPINIVSLAPMDALSLAPSWKANVGMQTIRHNGCELCSNGVGNVGIGASAETQVFKREVYFALASHARRSWCGGGVAEALLGDPFLRQDAK